MFRILFATAALSLMAFGSAFAADDVEAECALCLPCAESCTKCAAECRKEGRADCAKMCETCAAVCRACDALKGTPEGKTLKEICQKICLKCAESCEKSGDETCKACAKKCRACASCCLPPK